MRTENSLKNLKVNLLAQIINLFVQFFSRSIFIKLLGNEYLGINGLFSNILTILSLADLGIGNVLIYSMYKPLADKDEHKLVLLMKEYKKIYNYIAIIILIVGLGITPFVNLFINGKTSIPNIQFIFLLYLVNTVVSYLCIYKISIINADQKGYIVTVIQQTFNILSNIVLIIILYLTHNFIIYLIIQMFFAISCNIYLSKQAEKMYSFITINTDDELSKTEKNKIFRDTRAMMLHKVGGVVVSGTDNILMSSMISLATVGIYSNYLLIINSLKKFTNLFFSSISSSVGNLNVQKSKEYTYNIFKKVFYCNFLIYSFSTICLICLFNPFISLWLGEKYIFNFNIVLAICISFYIDGMRQSVLTFRDSLGLFEHDRYKSIFESILNLGLSILLGLKFGIIGIILGTIISMGLICVGTESYVLFRYGFKKSILEYIKMYIKYFVIGLIVLITAFNINKLFLTNSIIFFSLRTIVTVLITLLLLVVFTCKTDEFKFYIKKIKKL